MAKQTNAGQLANEACDQGFQEGVRKMVEILLQGSTTPTEHKQAMQRFRKGLRIYKEAYASAQQAIAEVFSGA
jgi:predicted secreted protein